MFEKFSSETIDAGEASIFLRRAGDGPAVLLLHGFPETHLAWRHVAPALAKHNHVVCADLRGYGQSSCPPSNASHAPYAKRAMAQDMVAVMQKLGFESFAVVGHDRGGRVAYRLALDAPMSVSHLAVLDIVSTEAVWARADARLATGFWPWSLLAQASPLPEQMIGAAPDAVIDDAIAQWGTSADAFPADVRAAYVEALRGADRIHAICEDYRAAATLDREHDQADLRSGHRIACPVLALWGSDGAVDTWYANAGGPLALWRDYAKNAVGRPIAGGHFFPESNPEETANEIAAFLARRPDQ